MEKSTRIQCDSLEAIFFKWSTFCKISDSAYLYAGKEKKMNIKFRGGLLYDSCGVHHVSTEKGIDIYMLVEKEYPLSRGTLTLMLVAKLLVDQDNEMSRELLRKIFMQVERPRR
ncbi:hypothetical protein Tco_0595356 [Tanacetum coccineum]